MPHRRPASDASFHGIDWSPRDILIPYVLLAVSMGRAAHGYLIEDYLKSLGFFRTDASTLYRTLRQLEKDGLLLSTWETGQTGPARRVYSLTDAGRAWLDAWVATLEVYRSMIDNFFSLYTSLYTGGTSTGEGAAPAEKPDGGDEH
jgi:poly-beta-hydroxybutyrate-responsive repressor